jgi:hypothetical protein
VNAVDAEQYAVAFGATGVERINRVGDLANRELHARARVHPRDREHAGLRPDGARDAVGDLVFRRSLRPVVQRDLADCCT